MKRQLHTRSKNLQSTFVRFVEFQFTEEMLWCKCRSAGSQIPDRLRLGVRGRVDVDCSRRDSEDSVDPDHVGEAPQTAWRRRLNSAFQYHTCLVTFSSVSRFRSELQALSTKAESPISMYFLLFLFHPFPESLGGHSANFTQNVVCPPFSVSGSWWVPGHFPPNGTKWLLISIASLGVRVITRSLYLRGPKSLNFPSGNFQRAKTFRTKCVNRFLRQKKRIDRFRNKKGA